MKAVWLAVSKYSAVIFSIIANIIWQYLVTYGYSSWHLFVKLFQHWFATITSCLFSTLVSSYMKFSSWHLFVKLCWHCCARITSRESRRICSRLGARGCELVFSCETVLVLMRCLICSGAFCDTVRLLASGQSHTFVSLSAEACQSAVRCLICSEAFGDIVRLLSNGYSHTTVSLSAEVWQSACVV